MFISLCCRRFSFCMSFLCGRILFQRKQIIFGRCQESRGWGIVSFCMPRGWRIGHQWRKNRKSPGVYPGLGGGGVTARIEPCITIGPVHVRPRRTVRLCRKVPIVATLVTFGISSLWGSLLSGGGSLLSGGALFAGNKNHETKLAFFSELMSRMNDGLRLPLFSVKCLIVINLSQHEDISIVH